MIQTTHNGRTTSYIHPELGPVATVTDGCRDDDGAYATLGLWLGPDHWVTRSARYAHAEAADHARSLL